MKILGLGIPELFIILLIVAVIAVVVVAVSSASKNNRQPQIGSQNNQDNFYSANQAQQQSQLGEQLTPQALEQYAQLYKDGALSKEEFEAIKARFLSE